jgi:caffeoyl-CoA O-methyltransferase
MNQIDQALVMGVDQYIDTLFAPQDDALEAARQSQSTAGMPQISVSPNQGKLLHVLALLRGARRILEIGTLAGYSAIWMARALPADGHLITLEHNADYARVAQENLARAGLTDKVEIWVGDALDSLAHFAAEEVEPFDMIFIDADKPPYPEYLRWAIHLAKPGTLIVADNVVRKGSVIDEHNTEPNTLAIRQFNEMLAAELSVVATVVQMVGIKGYDGMALAVVR